jgi:hypothetical protein
MTNPTNLFTDRPPNLVDNRDFSENCLDQYAVEVQELAEKTNAAAVSTFLTKPYLWYRPTKHS